MSAAVPEDLALRLREAGRTELEELVERHLQELDPALVRQLLRNPFVTTALIGRLAEQASLVAAYEFRRDLAAHPSTPQILAFRFLAGLHWPDLVRVGGDSRLHPLVRRAAERRLVERLPGLALGEKMSIARSASLGVVAELRFDPSPRVIAALLDNPRLTEGALAPLLASERALAPVLAVIAAHPRWGCRYPIRVALARNPRTPVTAVLPLLSALKKPDLMSVASDHRLSAPVRQRAQLLAHRTVGES